MIKIAICDDSRTDVEMLEKCLESLQFTVDADVFYSGSELAEYLRRQGKKYHLYILDVELPDINGVDLARRIREQDEECLIAFLTSHPGYVYEVFDIWVYDYILKPVTAGRVERLMLRARKTLEKQGKIFYYHFKKVRYGLNAEKIILFQKDSRIIEIHTIGQGIQYTYMKMDEVMEQISPVNFARISYSCIVNLKYVIGIKGQIVYLSNGMSVNISRNLLKEVKEKHLKYLCGEAGR